MRQLLISILLFFSLVANAQTETKEQEDNDSIDVEIIKLPETTAIGAAAGKLISKEIGVSGGKIVSDDGRVELIFPEGALKENTTISIQPIENLLPNGKDKGYRFEPSGIKFEKPVELIFHYTKEDEAICPALFMFMAIQDDKGNWEYMDYDDWDSTTRILKGYIRHFSQMVNGNEVRLNDDDITLKLGETHVFKLFIVEPPPPPKPAAKSSADGGTSSADAGTSPVEDELPPLPNIYIAPLGKEIAEWLVNGIKGGDAKVGKIKGLKSKVEIKGKSIANNNSTARYYTPSILPGDGFVTVELKTYMIVTVPKTIRTGKNGKYTTYTNKREYLASLSCKVHLYDEYRITIKVEGKSILDCGAELADSSSFNIKLFGKGKPEITGVENRPPKITKPSGCNPLKYTVMDSEGPVHFNDKLLKKYAYDNSTGEVTMEFVEVKVRVVNSKGKIPQEIHDFPGADFDTNLGNLIKFKANRTYQKYPMAGHDIYIYPR